MQCIRCNKPCKGKEITCTVECKLQYSLYHLANSCWGIKHSYGKSIVKIRFGMQYINAVRLCYEIYIGKLHPEDNLNKTCKTYRCVNPYHYEKEEKPGTLEKIKGYFTELTSIIKG